MKIQAYISPPKTEWRSVVVSLPLNDGPSASAFYFMSNEAYDRWARVHCNKQRLRNFAKKVREKFQLPKKPRVWGVGISRRYSCHIWVYKGEGTAAERRLFRKVLGYAEKYAPREKRSHKRKMYFGELT